MPNPIFREYDIIKYVLTMLFAVLNHLQILETGKTKIVNNNDDIVQ
jgi:hypothetical protein